MINVKNIEIKFTDKAGSVLGYPKFTPTCFIPLYATRSNFEKYWV